MDEYLNQGIKDIIRQFPEVGDILKEYNIGCVPCAVGTCLLKDIIDIHSIALDEERELMARISGAVHPDQAPATPRIEREPRPSPKQSYSPPMQKLVDEHGLIKRFVALIPQIMENLDVESEEGRQIVINGVDFIRSYADRYHHAKEEDILLKYFDEGLEIIKTIYEDHETGRAHVRATLQALEDGDKEAVREHLDAYRELLTEHIEKEDGTLYPWMDRSLSVTQVGELYARFNAKDEGFGDTPKRYEALINRLEQEFAQKEAVT
ncbi:MAG: hemerythrin domain-containing protein [Dehalococcoidia bacterium]